MSNGLLELELWHFCSLFVHYLFIIRSLFYYSFIICSLFVHYLFIICSLFHNSFIICSLFVHYSFIICSLFHNSFIICSLFVHYSLIIRSLFIHYLLSFVHYLFIICSLFLRNRVNLRFHYCLPNKAERHGTSWKIKSDQKKWGHPCFFFGTLE